MKWFWHNTENEILKANVFHVHSEYSRPQWIVLALLWILLLPVGLVLYLLART